jgi:hypothetical protein
MKGFNHLYKLEALEVGEERPATLFEAALRSFRYHLDSTVTVEEV